jgi:hypothetical protein
MSHDDNYINSITDVQELHNIVKRMHNNASLGQDGFNTVFYKSAWPWIAQDVHKLVTYFFTSASFQQELNHTFIALIPKKIQPVVP